MTRQVVLDTETTGLEPKAGHRIIEIGCVEMINRQITGKHFHHYMNPEREIDAEAVKIHGITNEFLADKPRFQTIVQEFMDFIQGAELIIHNATFDLGFLDHELKMASAHWGRVQDHCTVFDTLACARQLHPGKRNSLDALCERYAINNSHRELHGALLDAEILASVYLAMTGGQVSLFEESGLVDSSGSERQNIVVDKSAKNRQTLCIIAANEQELTAHEQYLAKLRQNNDGFCVWDAQN